jgi:hypothetical protein
VASFSRFTLRGYGRRNILNIFQLRQILPESQTFRVKKGEFEFNLEN